MDTSVEQFLSLEQEKAIVKAIQEAEKNTSGEIRVHLEKKCTTAPLERAVAVFKKLQMDKTALRNGVLFYVAVEDRVFAIYGDTGIDQKVNATFWDTTKDKVIQHFKQGDFTQGLIDGILEAAKQLKTHFPWQQEDINELPDQISKG